MGDATEYHLTPKTEYVPMMGQSEKTPLLSTAQSTQLARAVQILLLGLCCMALLTPHIVAIIVTLNYANVDCVLTHVTTESLVNWNWVAALTNLSAYAYLAVILACVGRGGGRCRSLLLAIYAVTVLALLITGIVTLVPLNSGCTLQRYDWQGLYVLTIMQMIGPVLGAMTASARCMQIVGCDLDCGEGNLLGTTNDKWGCADDSLW